jgi:hypothetical protein
MDSDNHRVDHSSYLISSLCVHQRCSIKDFHQLLTRRIVGLVDRAKAYNRCVMSSTPRGVVVDLGPKSSGWLINHVGNPIWERVQKVVNYPPKVPIKTSQIISSPTASPNKLQQSVPDAQSDRQSSSRQSNKGTFCASGMAGIEPIPSESE